MRLFDLEIDGQKYPACCGLRALAQIQKKYGSLSAFEKKLLPYQEQTEKGLDEKLLDVDAMDIQMIMETTELFSQERRSRQTRSFVAQAILLGLFYSFLISM